MASDHIESRAEEEAMSREKQGRRKSEHERSIAWAERSGSYAFRMIDQSERIMHTRKTETDRMKAQEERILRQQRQEYERAYGARDRGETVTGVDTLERLKRYRNGKWARRWALRKAKWDHHRY
ncbi:MAG: hypothetical protein NWE85_01200 [Candidatus Bathyarchaeota archaeon]|nr:hypothetical protein [Candidatus Bathyarchaeota archaeon]